MTNPPVILCILDGLGHRAETEHNAVAQGQTPVMDSLDATCPKAFLVASGPAVGLPEGQVGNSEVGHMTIGAGRIIDQDLARIDKAVADGALAKIPALDDFISRLAATGGTAHLMGLVSPGGVHSRDAHIMALAKALTARGIPVALHAFTDGRDTLPQLGRETLPRFESELPDGAHMATVIGRYYAMDRDNRRERTEAAWRAIALAEGASAPDATTALANAYEANLGDEFIPPTIIGNYSGMQNGDGILMANFRTDRARQIMAGFCFTECGFDISSRPQLVRALGMVSYSDELDAHMDALFGAPDIPNTLGEVVARAGMRQLRLAETEKYPHVTFFLNGGREDERAGETHTLIPSPKVATYDLKPEMSAGGVLAALLDAIKTQSHDLIIVNFANPDMVGHTGSLPAAIAAVETVDAALGDICAALEESGGVMLVTADHGNCETMWDETAQSPHTAHTYNKVPIWLVGDIKAGLNDGTLADLAPTLLELLGLDRPADMTGVSLLTR